MQKFFTQMYFRSVLQASPTTTCHHHLFLGAQGQKSNRLGQTAPSLPATSVLGAFLKVENSCEFPCEQSWERELDAEVIAMCSQQHPWENQWTIPPNSATYDVYISCKLQSFNAALDGFQLITKLINWDVSHHQMKGYIAVRRFSLLLVSL